MGVKGFDLDIPVVMLMVLLQEFHSLGKGFGLGIISGLMDSCPVDHILTVHPVKSGFKCCRS